MTNKLEVADFGVCEMRETEIQQTEGGIVSLLFAHALLVAVLGSMAAGIYASYKQGYNAL